MIHFTLVTFVPLGNNKVQLMAKGYNQTYGIDYNETFAPMAKISTIRTLISLAVNKDWRIHQLDGNKCILSWRVDSISAFMASFAMQKDGY